MCLLISYRHNSEYHSPYYIWLGRPRAADVSKTCHAFEIEGGNTVGNCSPNSSFKVVKDTELSLPPLDLGSPIIDQREEKQANVVINITPPFSSFHYQVNKVCVSNHHPSKPITESFYLLTTHIHSRGGFHIIQVRYTNYSERSYTRLLGHAPSFSQEKMSNV